MGNSYGTKVQAAESGGLLDSLKTSLLGSASPAQTPLPSTPSRDDSSSPIQKVDSSGDSSSVSNELSFGDKITDKNKQQSSVKLPSLEEDPKTLVSTIPSFPGSWNELHKCKDVFPTPFDGLRAVFNKGLSHHFQVTHNFTLGTMQPSGYKFGATFVGTKQLSQTETFPILLGEMDPSGNLSAQCIHAFTRNTRSRLVGQHQGGTFQALELGTDYRGANTTIALTAANPDLLALTGIYVAQALYAVTPRLALGVEGLLHRGLNPAVRQVATQFSASLVAKYNADNWSTTVQIAPLEKGVHASYYHKLNDHQAVGVEIEGKGNAGECCTTLGYAFEIPGAECTIKTSVDSNLNIGTVVEKKLLPLPMTLNLSCQGNQKKAQYLAGIGINVG